MKTIRYALIALLLMALLAVPAFAEPEGDATVPVQTVFDGEIEPEESTDADDIQPASAPDVTYGIVAINETLDDEFLEKEPRDDLLDGDGLPDFESTKPTPLEYVEANAISYAALAIGALALLLSVIALAKSQKQSGRRKMKNYF